VVKGWPQCGHSDTASWPTQRLKTIDGRPLQELRVCRMTFQRRAIIVCCLSVNFSMRGKHGRETQASALLGGAMFVFHIVWDN